MHYKLQKSFYLAQLKVHSKHLAWRNKANKPTTGLSEPRPVRPVSTTGQTGPTELNPS